MIKLNDLDIRIIREYLFGKDGNLPQTLLTADLIRAPLPENDQRNRIDIDAVAYMNRQTGAGRFALPTSFDLVNAFFLPYSNFATWPKGAQGNLTDNYVVEEISRSLAPGRYTRADLDQKFGLTNNKFTIQQYSFADSRDDYAARTLIYGSSQFILSDNENDVPILDVILQI